jgi:glycosyltransferase involved in cell wall biosynthesis
MDIADKMMLIYKDETLRNGIIEKSKNLIEDYNWEKTTDAIVKTFNN